MSCATNAPSLLGVTHSACESCLELVPAKIEVERGNVRFRTFCPTHGEQQSTVSSDAPAYLAAQRFVKPAWTPLRHAGKAGVPCPDGCGFCVRHEQHLCLPIVEITTRCDLCCPVCINSSGGASTWDMSLTEFRSTLDHLIASEKQIDVLNISGGEPLLHPQLVAMLDEANGRPEIVRVSISTNGRALLRNPEFLGELVDRNVVVSLQFDGFDDAVYQALRGQALTEEKLSILGLLRDRAAPCSLTMTAVAGLSDAQYRPVLDMLFSSDHILSLMIQPLAFAGRARTHCATAERLGTPGILDLLDRAGHPAVTKQDFVPLPCSHPLCFSLAFYLCLDDGGTISLNRLAPASTLMDTMANRLFFGLAEDENRRLKELIYELWTGPSGALPDSERVLRTLKRMLTQMNRTSSCDCFDPRRAFGLAERSVKSIFIHAFQDAATFDLARVRRCCQAYPQPDGTLIPACVRNVLRPPEP